MEDLDSQPTETPLLPQPTTLKEILHLERIENWIFRGVSPANPRWGRVYGGQLVAQSIAACVNTLDPTKHSIHSFHGYFIRPGDDDVPIVYQVTPLKDTKAFVTRRVDAQQYGQIIFSALLQFAAPDLNVHSHTQVFDMSTIPHYDSLPSLSADMFELSTNENLPLRNRQLLYYTAKREIPFDIKWINREDVEWVNWSDTPTKRPARRLMWVKIKGKIHVDEEPAKSASVTQTKPTPATTTTISTVKKYFPNPESTGSLLGYDSENTTKVQNEAYKQQTPSLKSLLQHIALAYMSDWGIIAAATKPHQMEALSPHMQLASLDHTIHFFNTNIQADDWLLFDVHSPHFTNSKALLCGDFYNQKGELVARIQQEALIRVKNIDAVSRYPSFYHTSIDNSAKSNIKTQANGKDSGQMNLFGINSNNAIIKKEDVNIIRKNNNHGAIDAPATSIVIKDSIGGNNITQVQSFEQQKKNGPQNGKDRGIQQKATGKDIAPEMIVTDPKVQKLLDNNIFSTARL